MKVYTLMLYVPQEDSYLLKSAIANCVESGKTFLDMGTGTGIQGKTAKEKGAIVTTADIDSSAKADLPFIQSDMFSNIKGKYDIIAFNPPYLPLDENEPEDSRLQTTGGKYGYEIAVRFIQDIGEYFNDFVLLLISSLTNQKKVEEELYNYLYDYEIVCEEKIPFETLYVYKIIKGNMRKELENKNLSNIKAFTHGKRGNILTGNYKNKKVAIKTQRATTTFTINHESNVLKDLATYNIGPKLLFSGNNYFVYEFVEGKFFPEWTEIAPKDKIKSVLINVLEQMRKLDKLNYTKEEMHHPYKHIIVNNSDQPVLLDFERCKKGEKSHNVTQFIQYIISIAYLLEPKDICIDRDKMIKLAKEYGKDYKEEIYKEILKEI